ncbi:hypothetical protein [Phocaeicola sp.]
MEKAISSKQAWQAELQQKLPLLGHRNWIVVTDMAYPLQTKQGITTLFADEPYKEVLACVQGMLNDHPHVYAHVYQDKELLLLTDKICPGVGEFKEGVNRVIPADSIVYRDHEELISTLDEVSNLFQVVIIKTNLAMPYTSTFMELDCKYWNAEKQAELMK